MEIIKGQIYPGNLRTVGGSYYVILPPEMLDYLGITQPEGAKIVLTAEHSKKWGNYFGLGKDKR